MKRCYNSGHEDPLHGRVVRFWQLLRTFRNRSSQVLRPWSTLADSYHDASPKSTGSTSPAHPCGARTESHESYAKHAGKLDMERGLLPRGPDHDVVGPTVRKVRLPSPRRHHEEGHLGGLVLELQFEHCLVGPTEANVEPIGTTSNGLGAVVSRRCWRRTGFRGKSPMMIPTVPAICAASDNTSKTSHMLPVALQKVL